MLPAGDRSSHPSLLGIVFLPLSQKGQVRVAGGFLTVAPLHWSEDPFPASNVSASSSHCFPFLLGEETTPQLSLLPNRCIECSSSPLSFDKCCDCLS